MKLSLAVLVLLGLSLTVVLLYRSFTAVALPGCGAGSACDAVLATKWAKVFGLPVSLPAVAAYVVVGAMLFFTNDKRRPRVRRQAWFALLLIAGLLSGAAVWFILVQLVFIDSLCKWCMAAHAVGLATAGAIWLMGHKQYNAGLLTRRLFGFANLVAFAGLATLIIAQLTASEHDITITRADYDNLQTKAPDEPRRIAIFNGVTLQPNPDDFIMRGPPDAPTILVCLYDYACLHCRVLHDHLLAAREHYGDQLAIIFLPAPVSGLEQSEPIDPPAEQEAALFSRIAVALWRTDREAFKQYEHWVYERSVTLPPSQAYDHAASLVGEDILKAALADSKVEQHLQRIAAMQHLIRYPNVPVLAWPGGYLPGAIEDREQFFDFLEANTPLQ